MLTLSLLLFGLVAIGGAVLATWHLRPDTGVPPRIMAWGHGAGGLTALVLLIIGISALPGDSSLPLTAVTALALFCLTALGGIYMFVRDRLRRQPPPTLVIAIHGTAAVLGLFALLAWLVD